MSSIIQPDDPRLKQFALFSGLAHDELATLVRLTDKVSFKKDAKIIQAGEEGHCLYLLLSGTAVVQAPPPDGKVELASLKIGDFFGEISLVDEGPRSADVVALEDCELLRITRTTIGVLAGLQPAAAVQILSSIGRELVQRLRTANQKYLDLLNRLAR
ncbi:MAG: Crp/Fnr family transcriptional regulator [Terrimicrobiaceae bacterium]